MKRNIARIAFWCLFYIMLSFIGTVCGTIFGVSSDVDSGSMIFLLVFSLLFAGGIFLVYRIYDPFREKYSVLSETPLGFHKFICYVSLPLGIVFNIKSIYDIFSGEDFSFNFLYLIDLSYALSSLILICVCFVGLRKLKSYAWYALMINYFLGVVYSFVAGIIYIILSPSLLNTVLPSLVSTIYVAAIICMYYYKRKRLFLTPVQTEDIVFVTSKSTNNNKIEMSEPISTRESEEQQVTDTKEEPEIRFCRKCGFELLQGSKFCSRCGAEIIRM